MEGERGVALGDDLPRRPGRGRCGFGCEPRVLVAELACQPRRRPGRLLGDRDDRLDPLPPLVARLDGRSPLGRARQLPGAVASVLRSRGVGRDQGSPRSGDRLGARFARSEHPLAAFDRRRQSVAIALSRPGQVERRRLGERVGEQVGGLAFYRVDIGSGSL